VGLGIRLQLRDRQPTRRVVFDTGTHLIDTLLFALGVDRQGTRAGFDLIKASKSPDVEPPHACEAELMLHTADRGDIPVGVLLSRRDAFASAAEDLG
jgi:hypothetical protein